MYPDLPIARGGARELGRGEVERRGEKARRRGDVERPRAERGIHPRHSEVMGAALQKPGLVRSAQLWCDLEQERQRARHVRRGEGRTREARRVEAEAIGRADAGACSDERRELPRVTARRACAGEGGDRRGVGRGADRERLRQVGR